ncbi:MAG TPA: hypothetical protein VGM39_24850 [Kofleriaceae bacterium]|jgi:hypothetical protein
MRRLVLLLALGACGGGGDHHSLPDAPHGDDDAGDDATLGSDAGLVDASTLADAAPTPDAFPATLDLRIDCHNTCVLTANPGRIDVPTGTEFDVNWINVGDTTCDVAKVDQFNHVPIVLDLEPGQSYHDTVRKWCGTLFTGTFDFEVRICELPSYIPVDCSADQ